MIHSSRYESLRLAPRPESGDVPLSVRIPFLFRHGHGHGTSPLDLEPDVVVAGYRRPTPRRGPRPITDHGPRIGGQDYDLRLNPEKGEKEGKGAPGTLIPSP